MRTKLLSAILLASTALAGVASADPYVRDHRNQPTIQTQAQVSYGFQVDHDGDEIQPYAYGQDPSPEYAPRWSWQNFGDELRFNWSTVNGMVVKTYGRSLASLELQSERGCTNIRKVMVQLNDGRMITIKPMRDLDAQHAPNLRLDLGAQASRIGVKNVTILGSGSGQFRVLGA